MNILNIFKKPETSIPPMPTPSARPASGGSESGEGYRPIITTMSAGGFDPRHPGKSPKTSDPIPKVLRLYEAEHRAGFRPQFTSTFKEDLIRDTNVILADKAFIDEMIADFERRGKLMELKVKYSCTAVFELLKRQMLEQIRLVGEGRFDEAEAAQVRATVEVVDKEYQVRRRGIAEDRRKTDAKIKQSERILAERLSAAAMKLHNELEPLERAECEKQGVPFVPSARLMLLGQLTWRAEELAGGTTAEESLRRFGIKL